MGIVGNAILVALTLILGGVPLLLTAHFKTRLRFLKERTSVNTHAPAALILPCKGLDPGFRKNVRALLQQDYPMLEFLFVVATQDDLAYEELQKLLADAMAENPEVKAKLLVAGITPQRAQKLTNQLVAVDQVSQSTEVLVFIDSDIRPDPGFIGRLVGPLGEPGVGATTGFRWYHPPRPTLGSLLRSTWNAGALPFLVDPKRNFAWGGAMAIRRETFEAAGISKAWQNAVSDDFPFTHSVRQLGLEVRFVPECMAVSYEASTVAETLEFTNRQSIISRVYFPPHWWSTAIGHAIANILLLFGFVSLALWLNSGSTSHLLGSCCLLLLPLQLANAAWLFGSVRHLLPQLGDELPALRWHYIGTAPLASLLTLINTVYSFGTRRIKWRGIEYELRSPVETIVLSTED